ncbi:hypothetical protein JNB63_16330 [Microbacterium trichothecenolyticum]|uniref:EF-hand domain-containing protein n=1 Tax=Microbacterium ureisolvens TaxID=2781186 RepID=A0ABS7HXA9_9MICO|nr:MULTISPECIES: hypothetical protein [Microbacterium]MBW9109445.1 hypothetical protein [Microbacterium ureisolvens]MBW9121667.1 hypothetical protein [Microbacterium trichothecenolyticum]
MQSSRSRLIAGVLGAAIGALSLAAATPAFAAGSGGVTDDGVIYVDHELWRTVATPTDLSHTRAPAQSWDIIYSFGGLQMSVAEVAPGDPGFNGGRWQVHALSAPNGYAAALASGDLDHDGVLDAADEVRAALTAGDLIDNGVVKQFVCTLNRVP